jgi:hypothetical protein
MLSRLRVLWGILDRLGWVIALVFLAIGFFVVKGQGVSLEVLRVSQLRACHRLNVVRAQDNQSHYDDFKFDTSLALLLRVALAQPQTPNPALSRVEQEENLRRVDSFVGGLGRYAKDKQWTPLTRCYPATYHPLRYVAPTPVPFAKRPPPHSALYVGPGE